MSYAEMMEATKQAFAAPQVGDRFHEMFSFWMFIVAIEGDEIIVMTATPPCTFPRDGRVERYPCVHAFRAAWSYSYDSAKYTVLLADRGNDVSGWYTAEVSA